MKPLGLERFEDQYWTRNVQELQWRHEIALGLVEKEPVIDIGGGDGFFLKLLRDTRQLKLLTSLDASPVAVDRAKQAGFEARVWNLSDGLPYPDHSFETCCALDVLEHLYDPLPVLREMARIARRVVVTVPNFNYWKDRLRVLGGRVPFQCKPRRGHVYWFTMGGLLRLVDEADLDVEAFVGNPMKRLGVAGGWLAQLRPSLFADSFAASLTSREKES